MKFSNVVRPTAAALTAGLLAALAGCPLPGTVPAVDAVGLELLASDITAPVALAALPDDRLLVATQPGEVLLLSAAGAVAPEPYLDLTERVIAVTPGADERGLLGLALHPAFAANGRLFVVYVAPAVEAGTAGEIRLAEYRAEAPGDAAVDAAGERILLRFATPFSNHNGGGLAFLPDGTLLMSVGDGGGAGDSAAPGDPGGNAQRLDTLLGKLLRIDVDRGDPYAIPADNPFAGDPNAAPEIYARGFRNPWRISVDVEPETGAARVFVGDVGQNAREEVNEVIAGGNYGWRTREGTACFSPRDDCPETRNGDPLLDPIIEYTHADGISVIGGFVYRGAAIPGLPGAYVFGDLTTSFLSPDGRLFASRESEGRWSLEELRVATMPSGRLGRFVFALGADNAGELYVLAARSLATTGTGEVWKVVPAP